MSDFKAKMHQIRFPLGLRPDPAGGAYSAPPDSLAVFKGPTSKGREERGKGRGERGKGRGGKGNGKGGGLEGPPISSWHRAPQRVNPALPERPSCCSRGTRTAWSAAVFWICFPPSNVSPAVEHYKAFVRCSAEQYYECRQSQ